MAWQHARTYIAHEDLNRGKTFCGCHAGEENLDFVESIRKSSIKLIVTRHEQTGGFMAATVGRLTGTAGVCLATLGPGKLAAVPCSQACI